MSDNAAIYAEMSQDQVAMTALTDDGDHTMFNSADTLWSYRSGYTPDVKPNGVATGGAVTAATANDTVSVAALTCYLAGVLTSVSADAALSVTRSDSSYLILTLAEAGYTDCVASDISKTVTGGVTGDTGTLIAYDNTNRKWVVDPDAAEDTFDDDDEAITIATGTGAGDLSAVGVSCPYKICSITVNSSGALAVVEGTQGTAFSTTRAAQGGPPLIPTGSVEVGWVKFSSSTAAAIASSEIKQVVGTSKEMYNYPGWTEKRMVVENGALTYAGVEFDAALPLIHTGSVPKAVYAEYYTPEFALLPETSDFVAPETSHSVSSTQIYGKTKGSSSSSLGQGSFTAHLDDGISDSLIGLKNEFLFFKFFQDRLVTGKYILCQGKLGLGRSFPADDGVTSACTISATDAAEEITA